MKCYNWYINRSNIERENATSILVSVGMFKLWINKKLCIKQEFGLDVCVFLREDSHFKDVNTNQEISARDIVECFKDNIRVSNKTLVENKQQQFKEQYKAKYQQANNTFIDKDYGNQSSIVDNKEDLKALSWDFNEDDLI